MASLKDDPEIAAGPRGLPRVVDIAQAAGVSTATVDRVLNNRPGVRAATVQRVLKAAAELDYLPDGDLYAAAGQKPMRLSFLLPAGNNRFLTGLGEMIRRADSTLAPHGVKAQVEFIKSFNPDLLARSLFQHGRRADGVAFMALEHPAVREAVDALADRNVPSVTLISDILNCRRAGYVGLDNRAAGRTAGYLIARFLRNRPAKVAMIAGSLSYRAHEDREMGFLHVLKEIAPDIEVVGLREGHDDEGKSYRQTRMLLGLHPDLAGVYNIGGGAEGVARALKETRREREMVFIGHGLTTETRGLLIDGALDAVITQDPRNTLSACVGIFTNLRAGRPAMQGVESPRAEVIFRENLPKTMLPDE
ncbi:LacI family transcriptional regulator [Azospirillum sp. TSH100]|uniref:LacI family DNA-binding transcriptional regulator n=1 Tax=Azospirillum sp. TSH100 TaxID=652764 RepID=UPI000D60D005|nr:LacI family DNA-binding transcriptional regulator [Azospirillum sp. TSH100]PWC88423.1 LacI family transcriptional regulator [Azospirillum sp. TSH100]QCG90522.1 LacI family DNA-binding transcriptional regulator [Azospirillum sp. TSH100]